jgi:murein DD-endopeptidase MepM/ murein hydrolase activator NlpD
MYGGKDARLVHACARGPDGRFHQQQQAVVAQAGKTDVFAQRRRQVWNNSLACEVNFACTCRQIGDRATLRKRRRAAGIAGRKRLGRRHEDDNSGGYSEMGMILVARSRRSEWSGALLEDRRRANRRLCRRMAAGIAACSLASAGLAVWIASPSSRTLAKIDAMHQQIAAQKAELRQVRDNAQRDVTRMAMRLGELQADSARLDALGQRLVVAGKLDPAEFDFSEKPGLGGPEASVPPERSLPYDLSVRMERLGQRFDVQQTQLGVLQSLLTDRQVSADLIPTGMPVKNGYITSSFGERIDPFTGHESFHPGLDIGVAWGSQVHAVADGVVTYAGARPGYGKVVEIDHGDGYMTRYAHNSKLLAHVGEHVRTGEVISDAGSSGRSTGPHVHFEVWHDGKLVNPIA